MCDIHSSRIYGSTITSYTAAVSSRCVCRTLRASAVRAASYGRRSMLYAVVSYVRPFVPSRRCQKGVNTSITTVSSVGHRTIPITPRKNTTIETISILDTWKLSFSVCIKITGMPGGGWRAKRVRYDLPKVPHFDAPKLSTRYPPLVYTDPGAGVHQFAGVSHGTLGKNSGRKISRLSVLAKDMQPDRLTSTTIKKEHSIQNQLWLVQEGNI